MPQVPKFVALCVGLAFCTWCTVAPAQSCSTSMRYLEAKLPKYRVAELENLRDSIVTDNANDVFGKFRAAGTSVPDLAASMLQHARSIENHLASKEVCMWQFSRNPEAPMRDVLEGRWKFSATLINDMTAQDLCVFSIVTQFYGMVATKEMALALSCLANAR